MQPTKEELIEKALLLLLDAGIYPKGGVWVLKLTTELDQRPIVDANGKRLLLRKEIYEQLTAVRQRETIDVLKAIKKPEA